MECLWVFFILGVLSTVDGYRNTTIDAVPLQLRQFKKEHQLPIGTITTTSGAPVDIRNTKTLNTDIFINDFFVDLQFHVDNERIPERVVHAKGKGAHGYFVVTNDVSKYTKADVFNGIGKKTPVFGRFSTTAQSKGGSDLQRENKAISIKMYTKDGNLDFLCLHVPVFEFRDPVLFTSFVHSVKRNPKTNIMDNTALFDFATLKPLVLHPVLWRLSDYGIPYGYRKMDVFAIHAYELNNEHGERYLAKFNFRTEIGLDNLTTAQAQAINSQDPDYFTRDLYNAIANKNYPSWRLELDVMPFDDAIKLDYNPFDVTRLWKKGTYNTVVVGRLVFDRNPENEFRDGEQSAFNPANLVPGIPGPHDLMFKSRRIAYRHTHEHRLGSNAENIKINLPKFKKVYVRDGEPPVGDNMNDAPNYYPNSYNGPVPFVDEPRPREKYIVLDKNSVDFEPLNYFYNHILDNDASRQRLADNMAASLVPVDRKIVKRVFKLLDLIDPDLRRRTIVVYKELKRVEEAAAKLDARTRYKPLAQCITALQRGETLPVELKV